VQEYALSLHSVVVREMISMSMVRSITLQSDNKSLGGAKSSVAVRERSKAVDTAAVAEDREGEKDL